MRTDVELQQAVLSELKFEPCLGGRRIAVAVSNGVVRMTGHVETFDERAAVDSAVTRVVGHCPFVNGVSIRKESPQMAGQTWVDEVRRSLEHDPNNIHRALTGDSERGPD